ncbi:low molecular weight phosphotyrosine protein phosphatase [Erysipelothrix sp. HDW6C]|uniref:low molecular weight protein-tyrosine-phosphatase n=1 Tax=Erysipelothrix sp. HDW6C TaxID=2714930 RepID=UPI00140AE526|nr:low molecular weight protein-tyrosine-phosphatase [Erysipelothrix sp. HDW6C]QIK70738.1 low molecular weight phosphotyrosine protein phosphatase [Erysipelothrix sp. HDW6C]
MKKVLFVCLGNICRSPMAEAIFKDMAAGLIDVDSAATSRWNDGQAPHKGTQDVLKSRGLHCDGMFARQITPDDFLNFDYIIGMDSENVDNLKAIAPEGTLDRIHLFLDIVDGREGQGVPDPWYTGDFDETERLVVEGSRRWVEYITNQV